MENWGCVPYFFPCQKSIPVMGIDEKNVPAKKHLIFLMWFKDMRFLLICSKTKRDTKKCKRPKSCIFNCLIWKNIKITKVSGVHFCP
jgi:hypothetical protein